MHHNVLHLYHETEININKCIASSTTRCAQNKYHPVIFPSSDVLQTSIQQRIHSSFMHDPFSRTHNHFSTSVSAQDVLQISQQDAFIDKHSALARSKRDDNFAHDSAICSRKTHPSSAIVNAPYVLQSLQHQRIHANSNDHFSRAHNNCDIFMASASATCPDNSSAAAQAHDVLQRPRCDTLDIQFAQVRNNCMLLFSQMINSHSRRDQDCASTIYFQHSQFSQLPSNYTQQLQAAQPPLHN